MEEEDPDLDDDEGALEEPEVRPDFPGGRDGESLPVASTFMNLRISSPLLKQGCVDSLQTVVGLPSSVTRKKRRSPKTFLATMAVAFSLIVEGFSGGISREGSRETLSPG
jgi:hypothetical protein